MWMVAQVAWVWAKMGIVDSDDAEAYGYVSDDESANHDDQDYHEENEEKFSPIEPKEPHFGSSFDDLVFLNRTRPEVCDKEVN